MKLRALLYLIIFLGIVISSAAAVASATMPASSRVEPGQVPAGLAAEEWADIQAQIVARQYHPQAAEDREEGGFAALNPAQGWRVEFLSDGTTRIKPRAGEEDWNLDFRLLGVGYKELKTLDRPRRQSAHEARLTTHWDNGLSEWWINSPRGLQQWFKIDQAPPGSSSKHQLRVVMTLGSDLNGKLVNGKLVLGNEDGTTLTFDGLKVWDAQGTRLPAEMQLAGQHLTLAVNDIGAQYPLIIDPTLQQQAYLKASNTDADDRFGFSVAVSGDMVVVGAPFEDSVATGVDGDASDNSAELAGASYVFVRDEFGGWTQQAYLKASNSDVGDRFGWSVAVSGDTVMVGAPQEDSAATGIDGDASDNSAEFAGAAYVFVRDEFGDWAQQAYLKASNTDASDQFGRSVAVSGDTVVVSASFEDSAATGVNGDESDNSAIRAGAAYVFVRDEFGGWAQQAYLKASNTDAEDRFGWSVAGSGDTVVVGAYGEESAATGVDGDATDNSASRAGAAYVFVRDESGGWTQQAYLKASNTDVTDFFGLSVALSGDTVVVGATGEESAATGVDGDASDNSASGAGAGYVFVRDEFGGWAQQAYLKASNTDAGDRFGESVAVSGDTVIVGADIESSAATGVDGDESDNSASWAGAAYVFVRDEFGGWAQQAYLKASNTNANDFFGGAVAVSEDTVIVGAEFEDSAATGVDGDASDNLASAAGAVYVFASQTHTVTPLAGSGGSINPATAQTIDHGDTATFTITPDAGYSIASVAGTCGGSLAGDQYTTDPVTADCSVEASFEINTYTVTPTAGAGGSIDPATPQTIDHGDTTTFTITPDTGYSNASVGGTCGGSLVGDQYTTEAVTADCSVEANFEINTYTVTPTAGTGGSIDPATAQTINHGNTATFTVTPDTGWSLQSFTGDTCTPSDNGDGTWTATAISADCEVTAEFIEDTTSVLTPSMSTAIVGMPVTYTIQVTGTASAPADGQIELVSDLSGVICTISEASLTNAETATFSCQHTWNEAGEHQLTATFEGSATHDDSEAQFQQGIVASEKVFQDRFQSE